MEFYSLIILGGMAFLSANIDEMAIALAYLADPTYNNKNILYGQILGFWVLAPISWWFLALFVSKRRLIKDIGAHKGSLLAPILMIGIGLMILAAD